MQMEVTTNTQLTNLAIDSLISKVKSNFRSVIYNYIKSRAHPGSLAVKRVVVQTISFGHRPNH